MDKKLVPTYISAVASLYFILWSVWGLPYAIQIIGALSSIAAVIGIRNLNSFYDGRMVVESSEKGKVFSLQLNGDPEDLEGQSSVSFKIVQESEEESQKEHGLI